MVDYKLTKCYSKNTAKKRGNGSDKKKKKLKHLKEIELLNRKVG